MTELEFLRAYTIARLIDTKCDVLVLAQKTIDRTKDYYFEIETEEKKDGNKYCMVLKEVPKPTYHISNKLEIYKEINGVYYVWCGNAWILSTKPDKAMLVEYGFIKEKIEYVQTIINASHSLPYYIESHYQDDEIEREKKSYDSYDEVIETAKRYARRPIIYGTVKVVDSKGKVVYASY